MTEQPFRYPSFSLGHTVGELQGELQRPPESLRKGRRCVLTPTPLIDEAEYDEVAQMFVTYLEPRHGAEVFLEEEIENA